MFCLSAPIALWEGYRLLPTTAGVVPALSYAELTTIVLAALTIVLAFLTLFVGGLAIWGYQSIKSEGIAAAEKSAQTATSSAVNEAISKQLDEGAIKRSIEVAVRRMVRKETREAIDTSLRYAGAFALSPNDAREQGQPTTEHIGKEYPEGESPNEG